MSRTLSATDLSDILHGACLYGAGGGGPFTLGQSLLIQLGKAVQPVTLATPQEMAASDSCCVAAGIGAPSATAKGFDLATLATSFTSLGSIVGTPFSHVMPAELGAVNSLLPMTVAASLNIPVLDAAGSFRAVPQIMQSSFATRGLPIGTVVLADAAEQVTFSAGGGPVINDGIMRAVISGGAFTDAAGVALWAMDAAAAGSGSIAGTTEAARQLGAVLRTATGAGRDPVAAVAAQVAGRVLITGSIDESDQQQGEGTDTGRLMITDEQGRAVTIISQNENLVAWASWSSRPAALAPDLIILLTTDGQPLSNADLQLAAGQQVAVIIAPADQTMRVPAMISAFQPLLRATGYAGPWQPVEQLWPVVA